MNTEQMRRRLYELYQLDWLSGHGYSVMDVVEEISECIMDRISMEMNSSHSDYDVGQGQRIGGRRYDKDTTDIYREEVAEWSKDGGALGEIWAGFNEFLNTEYTDIDYMLELAKRDLDEQILRQLYAEERGFKVVEKA